MKRSRDLVSDDSAFQSNTLWVSNLFIGTTDSDLAALFTRFGQIDRIAAFPLRWFAYIEYRRVEEAVTAKETLQGTILNGSRIKIDYARPAKPCNSLWVGGISPSVSDHELKAGFRKFGRIKELRILRHSKTALIDYFDINNAIQAMSMNGKQMGGSFLRVDFLWSPETRKVPCSSSNDGSSSATQQCPHSFGDVKGDDQSSKVLCISYPPSIQIDEEMISNSLRCYGEIVRCISYPSRHSSLVEFRTVEEARRAKEEQRGMLFGDSRIQIVYSNDEIPPEQGDDTRPEIVGHVSHFRGSMGRHSGPEYSHVVGNEGSWRGPSLALSTSLPIRPNHGNEGSRKRPSLALRTSQPIRPNHGSWEGYDPAQLDREPKRARRDGSVTNTDFSNTNFMWRGIIAKGGSPVCHTRCIPIGNGIESELPEIINCSAKTGLDKLAKHYAEAIGVEIAFFIPDRDEDLVSYTEFISYLDLNNRACVAKLDDGTTLFLVPWSDFLPDVVKVSGPRRLYGVVLKSPPPCVPAAASYRLGLSNEAPSQAWNRDQSMVSDPSNLYFFNQYSSVGQQTHPPPMHYPPMSNTPSYSGSMQYQAPYVGMPQLAPLPTPPINSYAMYSSHEVPMLNQNYRAVSGAVNPYQQGLRNNQTHDANPSQEQQELQPLLPRADQATLQFATNILQQIKQQQQLPPNDSTGQGTQD